MANHPQTHSESRLQPAFGRAMGMRMFRDTLAHYMVGLGGMGVIIAILLIFFYLVYIVMPLFAPAEANKVAQYNLPQPQSGKTLLLAIEEQNEIAVRFTDRGEAVFFSLQDGQVIGEPHRILPNRLRSRVKISGFTAGQSVSGLVGYGLSNGRAIIAKHNYDISYPGDKKLITPVISYPFGNKPVQVDARAHALVALAVQNDEERSSIAAITSDGRLVLTTMQKEENLLDEEESELTFSTYELIPVEGAIKLLLEPRQQFLYVVDKTGFINVIDIKEPETPRFIARIRVVNKDESISTIDFLSGGISLLIGTTEGKLSQWFPVQTGEKSDALVRIRNFSGESSFISAFSSEQRRKGFVSGDNQGNITLYHSTTGRKILTIPTSKQTLSKIAISPRADMIITEDVNHQLYVLHVNNEHPEVSWSVLWDKIWYEDYPEPTYTWQSSSASNDFEPKFSLTPLLFGTLKAAFYAMMIAIPLAIMGAIYSAYFMAPAMRRVVKPTIEIMEALPTVILGFLAGLWLAPMVEANLPGVFMMTVLLPAGVLVFAFAWQQLPISVRNFVPDGWTALLLLPVLIFLVWLAMALSQPVETLLFNGDMRAWMANHLGLSFDQRNSIVVGIAMGIAVIPTIFTITEDAIFSVPRHLTNGSLALGATLWQTLTRVVLLTASPGIFSAVMIGMGRAVGETMIVLMATGNTPVMDFSIFQGMRTLSANVAVEMPEAEVGSTHYRILFLAALVLFMFTFVLNAGAEIIRQRLRNKYSSL